MAPPPAAWRASKTVTSWPLFTSSPAAVRPAGPEPTTATDLPVARGGAAGGRPRRAPRHAAARALDPGGAAAAGGAGERVVARERRRGPGHVANPEELDEARDVHPDRA